MSEVKKPNLLVNFPSGFFKTPELEGAFKHLSEISNIRKTSHDTLEQIQDDASWADAIIMWAWPSFTDESLAKCPNLRYIGHLNGTQSSARACYRRGIKLSEVRHSWSPSVAELALGLILSGLRKISKYHIEMKQGTEKWVNDFPIDIDPMERSLYGRSVGLVGFGRIGQLLSQLMAPFKVDLRIYDPYVPAEVAGKFGAKKASVLEVIENSDVVVLCAANNSGTNKLIDEKEIKAFRKNSVLVNTGRSSLINMDALLERLQKNDMTAMLDVFDMEPLQPDSPFRKLDNAFLTPHRGGGIMATVERGLAMLTEDLEAFLAGKPLKYELTEQMLVSLPD